eukprot:4990652-Prymnesium_polylepis.1
MSLALASAERRSSAGRVIRPADPIRPGGVIPPAPQFGRSCHTTGQGGAIPPEGCRTLLPYLLA